MLFVPWCVFAPPQYEVPFPVAVMEYVHGGLVVALAKLHVQVPDLLSQMFGLSGTFMSSILTALSPSGDEYQFRLKAPGSSVYFG